MSRPGRTGQATAAIDLLPPLAQGRFVLDSAGGLEYFESDKVDRSKKKPLGSLDLSSATRVWYTCKAWGKERAWRPAHRRRRQLGTSSQFEPYTLDCCFSIALPNRVYFIVRCGGPGHGSGPGYGAHFFTGTRSATAEQRREWIAALAAFVPKN